MAKLTKGYPFAFQILGYLKWETNDDLEKLLPKFDEELIIMLMRRYGVNFLNLTGRLFM